MAETFNIFLIVMAVLAAGVYVALHFFEAGYGYLFNPKYGPPVPNKVGWVVMESPVFIRVPERTPRLGRLEGWAGAAGSAALGDISVWTGADAGAVG